MRRKVYSILAVFNKETLLKIIFNLRSRVDFKIEAHFKFEAQLIMKSRSDMEIET